MSDDRNSRLSKLKQAKTSTKIADAKEFGEVLNKKIAELAKTLNQGVEINNLDELIDELGGIKSLEAQVVELKEAIGKIELPSSVEIKGLADIVSATKEISKRKDPVVQKIDISVLDQVVDGVGNLIDKVEELKVPKQGQTPGDYIPTRRVVKVTGVGLMYDDSFYTGGGGGGSASSSGGGDISFDGTPVTAGNPLPVLASVSTAGLATDTNQTNGTQKTQLVDAGGDAVTVTGGKLDVNASVSTTGLATEAKQDSAAVLTGAVDETAPVSDTANSGLNGRLQRIAQRLTSLIALLPTSLGQKARASSLAVTLSSEDVTALTPTSGLTDAQLRATPVPVSGTVTANLSATDNAVLDQIELNTDYGTVVGGGTETGALRVTVANNSTGVLSVDDNGSTLSVDDGSGSLTVDAPVGTPAFVRLSDGASAISTLPVSLTSVPSHAVTNAGTFAVQAAQSGTWNIGTVTTLTGITNNVNTVEVAPTAVLNGKTTVTTAGTRVVLASSTTCKSVTIKALAANTGIIYVGNSTVASTNGFALLAGETVTMDIANLNTVNIDSSVNGEGVTYLGIN